MVKPIKLASVLTSASSAFFPDDIGSSDSHAYIRVVRLENHVLH